MIGLVGDIDNSVIKDWQCLHFCLDEGSNDRANNLVIGSGRWYPDIEMNEISKINLVGYVHNLVIGLVGDIHKSTINQWLEMLVAQLILNQAVSSGCNIISQARFM